MGTGTYPERVPALAFSCRSPARALWPTSPGGLPIPCPLAQGRPSAQSGYFKKVPVERNENGSRFYAVGGDPDIVDWQRRSLAIVNRPIPAFRTVVQLTHRKDGQVHPVRAGHGVQDQRAPRSLMEARRLLIGPGAEQIEKLLPAIRPRVLFQAKAQDNQSSPCQMPQLDACMLAAGAMDVVGCPREPG